MNATNDRPATKALTTALLLASLALGSLATTGCDRMTKEQVAALAAESGMSAGDAHGIADATELHSRISRNHNETFLTGAAA